MLRNSAEERYTNIIALKRWLTIQETSDYLSLSRWTIMGLIKSGKIPASRIGRSVRLDIQDLDRWMESQKKKEQEKLFSDGLPE